MSIDFTISPEQRKLMYDVREFSEQILRPVVAAADAEPNPLKGFQMTKPAYVESYKAGIAMCMLPLQYGGGGVSCVDLVITAEEICVVDPGFACTVLCNGLGLMPVAWYGSPEQKERFLTAVSRPEFDGVLDSRVLSWRKVRLLSDGSPEEVPR